MVNEGPSAPVERSRPKRGNRHRSAGRNRGVNDRKVYSWDPITYPPVHVRDTGCTSPRDLVQCTTKVNVHDKDEDHTGHRGRPSSRGTVSRGISRYYLDLFYVLFYFIDPKTELPDISDRKMYWSIPFFWTPRHVGNSWVTGSQNTVDFINDGWLLFRPPEPFSISPSFPSGAGWS